MKNKYTAVFYGLATAALTLALVFSAAVSVHAQTTASGTTNTGTNVTNSSTTGTTGTVGLPNTGAGGMTGANVTMIVLSAIAVAFGIGLAYRQYKEQ